MKQVRSGDARRNEAGANSIAHPDDQSHDLVTLSQLRPSAEEPHAPEADGLVGELLCWDESADERGHRVGALANDDPTVGENLVQQGVNEADAEIRLQVADAERGHLFDLR